VKSLSINSPLRQWVSLNSILFIQGMGQIAERFAEGAGTLREFAEEESGN
jgi:hypothetical protein